MTRTVRTRPTLRQLEYLVTVAQTLNFRAAAAAAHVSQPALSAQIQQLEGLLGLRLLDRDRRRVALTAAGELIAEQARAVLGDVDALVDKAAGQGQPLAGALQLGIIPTVAPYVLPRLLRGVHEAHPQLRLILRETQTADLVEQLRTRRLDAALLALPVPGTGLSALPLFEDPFLLALPAGHRLAARKTVKPADLRREAVLLLEDGHCLREQALAICAEAKAQEHGDVRATSLGTLMQMVGSGLGVTLLPSIAAKREARDDGVLLRPFAAPAPRRVIGLAWRASSTRGDEYALLAETLRKHVPAGAEAKS
jgi:LysR family transcriptional regulator, hydrogen peroxide-inducible genes activator